MKKNFAFFPEAAFGPALNSVAIAQAVTGMGHKAVFLSDPDDDRGHVSYQRWPFSRRIGRGSAQFTRPSRRSI